MPGGPDESPLSAPLSINTKINLKQKAKLRINPQLGLFVYFVISISRSPVEIASPFDTYISFITPVKGA